MDVAVAVQAAGRLRADDGVARGEDRLVRHVVVRSRGDFPLGWWWLLGSAVFVGLLLLAVPPASADEPVSEPTSEATTEPTEEPSAEASSEPTVEPPVLESGAELEPTVVALEGDQFAWLQAGISLGVFAMFVHVVGSWRR